jgi:hypothetical protein
LRVTPAIALPGRRPKGDGRHIQRDVEWLYRATVKDPRDTIRALAREYADRAGRRSDARSVVQIGIQRARDLLAVFDPLPK